MTVESRGLRPRTPSSYRSLALAGPTGHAANVIALEVHA